MKKTISQMMGMGHSINSKAHKEMLKKEYSAKEMSSKAGYGKSKKCPRCGKANCGCKEY
jgi:hypothetical protein